MQFWIIFFYTEHYQFAINCYINSFNYGKIAVRKLKFYKKTYICSLNKGLGIITKAFHRNNYKKEGMERYFESLILYFDK